MTKENGTRKTAASQKAAPEVAGPAPGPEEERRVKLDTSRMKSSYCNVCNATSTREEVVINFGLNQSWDRTEGDLEIEIQHRIIMSPHAAGKLREVLDELIENYEARYGPLKD